MKKLIIAISAILLFISCDRTASGKETVGSLQRQLDKQQVDEKAGNNSPVQKNTIDPPGQNDQDKTKQVRQTPESNGNWDKKIIKNAILNLEVKDYGAYNTSLRVKVKQFGGYIAQEQQSQSEYKIENTLIIKIPVDQFDDALNGITMDAKELKEKNISSEDVTTEVIDTRSRLEARKQVRLRYLDLLKQAKNMEEILSVQSEINSTQEEIEAATGRIEYLNHSSSFSTITLRFYQILDPAAVDPAKPSFSAKFTAAFREGWNWIQEVFIIIVSLWPIILAALGVYITYRKTRKHKIKTA